MLQMITASLTVRSLLFLGYNNARNKAKLIEDEGFWLVSCVVWEGFKEGVFINTKMIKVRVSIEKYW